MNNEEMMRKEALAKSIGQLGLLGLAGATGYAAIEHGPKALDVVGRKIEEYTGPLWEKIRPGFEHVGKHFGKYVGGATGLATFLATRGKLGGKWIIPTVGTGLTGVGAGTWWDKMRRENAEERTIWEQKLLQDQEEWSNISAEEDPEMANMFPKMPPSLGTYYSNEGYDMPTPGYTPQPFHPASSLPT
jgi:hypothetical protein